MSVCVFVVCARVSCSIAVKLAVVAEGTGSQVIAELTSFVLRLAESYPSISAFSIVDDGHFLIIAPIDFRLIVYCPQPNLNIIIPPANFYFSL